MNDNNSNPDVLFIVGMGRSGTSMFSRWLNLCGVDFGSNLYTRKHMNPVSNYEDNDIRKLHFEFLRYNKQPNSLMIDYEGKYAVPNGAYNKAMELLAMRNSNNVIGIKEPVATLFLPFWKTVVPNAKFILVYRDYKEVVDSVLRLTRKIQKNRKNKIFGLINQVRYFLNLIDETALANQALAYWIRNNNEALRFFDQIPDDEYIIINSDSFIEYDKEVFGIINDTFKLDIKYEPIKQIFDPTLFKRVDLPARNFDPLKELEAKKTMSELINRKMY